MGSSIRGFLLPALLLTAGLLNWSLISLVNLVSSLLLRFTAPKRGFRFKGRVLLWFIFLFSVITILLEVVFLIVWAILGAERGLADAWWMKLIGLMKLKSWRFPLVIYLLVVQLLAAAVTLLEIKGNRFQLAQLQDSHWEHLLSVLDHIGSRFRVISCLFLPGLQLIVGISNTSWLSLPFFICSCVGLVDWSLTSNFLGLFRWWKLLWIYAGFNICLLYFYQLPIEFPQMFYVVADYIGLYKISAKSEWQQICSGISLLAFYYLISFVKGDLDEMYFIMAMREGNLAERLLPSRHSFFVREHRSGVRHTNVLLKSTVFRIFTINFFTFPCLPFLFGASILQVYVRLGCLHILATFCTLFRPCFVCID